MVALAVASFYPLYSHFHVGMALKPMLRLSSCSPEPGRLLVIYGVIVA